MLPLLDLPQLDMLALIWLTMEWWDSKGIKKWRVMVLWMAILSTLLPTWNSTTGHQWGYCILALHMHNPPVKPIGNISKSIICHQHQKRTVVVSKQEVRNTHIVDLWHNYSKCASNPRTHCPRIWPCGNHPPCLRIHQQDQDLMQGTLHRSCQNVFFCSSFEQ